MNKNNIIFLCIVAFAGTMQATMKRLINNTNVVYEFSIKDSSGRTHSTKIMPGQVEDIFIPAPTISKLTVTPQAAPHKPLTYLYGREITEQPALNKNGTFILSSGQKISMYPLYDDNQTFMPEELNSKEPNKNRLENTLSELDKLFE